MASKLVSWTRLSWEDIRNEQICRLEQGSANKQEGDTNGVGNRMSAVDLEKAKKLKLNELKLVGSEIILKRVNRTLNSDTVDPLFFCEQILLCRWRYMVLKFNFCTNSNEDLSDIDLGYMVTQKFYEAIQTIRSPAIVHSPAIVGERDVASFMEIDSLIGWNAKRKFLVPYVTCYYLMRLHTHCETHSDTNCDTSCDCQNCKKYVAKLKIHIAYFPESLHLTVRAIENFPGHTAAPRSLKEMCLRRFLELELDEECLPVSRVQMEHQIFH